VPTAYTVAEQGEYGSVGHHIWILKDTYGIPQLWVVHKHRIADGTNHSLRSMVGYLIVILERGLKFL
jgi:hypothetical protein